MNMTSVANRRKEDRIIMDENVYVIIDTQPKMMGQMVEISSTGMAFNFVDLDSVSQLLKGRQDLKIDFFAAGNGFFMRDLSGRLVSAIDTPSANANSSHMIKRIGVEFIAPTLSQQVKINSLIRRQNERDDLETVSVPHGA